MCTVASTGLSEKKKIPLLHYCALFPFGISYKIQMKHNAVCGCDMTKCYTVIWVHYFSKVLYVFAVYWGTCGSSLQ